MTPEDEFAESDPSVTEPTGSVHEWGNAERPSIAIIEAVAATTDREPVNLPPLYDYVDSDALDAFVTRKSASTNGTVEATFTYDGVRVLVDSDGRIEIGPADRE